MPLSWRFEAPDVPLSFLAGFLCGVSAQVARLQMLHQVGQASFIYRSHPLSLPGPYLIYMYVYVVYDLTGRASGRSGVEGGEVDHGRGPGVRRGGSRQSQGAGAGVSEECF